jgi:hypothetical protein
MGQIAAATMGVPVESVRVISVVPMASEMPDIDVAHVETPTSVAELGAKGVGESGTGAAPAVVMNAAKKDALRPFGARVGAQPITPESVLIALGKRRARFTRNPHQLSSRHP